MKLGNFESEEAASQRKINRNTIKGGNKYKSQKAYVMLAVSKHWHVGKHTGISFGATHFPLAMSFVSKQSIREKSVAL